MIIALIVLFSLLSIVSFYLFLLCPEKAPDDARARFARRAYAHRGLYDNEGDAPENSLAAFEKAMQKGYGCELDVQFTSDKKLIVFHDNDYKRACGLDKAVWDLSWDETKELRLFGTNERVPLLGEALKTVRGREPLIVEIKAEELDNSWYDELCAATLDELSGYDGDYCVESFDPHVVGWLRKNAPDVVRGQLASSWHSRTRIPFIAALAFGLLVCDVIGRPHFIAYKESELGLPARLARALGALSVTWTCRDEQRHAELEKITDAIIFEGYEPAPRFADSPQ